MYCENCGKTITNENAMILKESLATNSYYCPKCYELKKKQQKIVGWTIFILIMLLLFFGTIFEAFCRLMAI